MSDHSLFLPNENIGIKDILSDRGLPAQILDRQFGKLRTEE